MTGNQPAINKRLTEDLKNASFIRKMFEQGEELKKIHGADKVFDFSLGNPEVEPPESVRESFVRHAGDQTPGTHRYMSNAGYPHVRESVAELIGRQSGIKPRANLVVMTVGAAGGLNIVLKTLLDPGDEVVAFAPYFKEYNFYAQNHGGRIVEAATDPETFLPSPEALERAVTARTKAVILNSPNNPTGAVYDAACLTALADAVRACEKKFGHTIYVISDEPYVSIVYDGAVPPQVFCHFENAIIINSYSKSLALAGERIGYVAVSPNAADADRIAEGLVFCNRVLGFVNAPAFLQRVVADSLEASVDVAVYAEKRDAICAILREAGFTFRVPQGAFYLFPKILGNDEEAFKDAAVRHNILIVPGSGFAGPGHFRLAFCVATETIQRSRGAFLALAAEYAKQ
ncbi:MAG: pyridoxal phosphate-dependent aminotransferase [Clostridiales bacterium]|jgi:aspartate aminotransferase|nr:pyridoxal phosphate-dependent aminotransferase [Clostridiales bacterium]